MIRSGVANPLAPALDLEPGAPCVSTSGNGAGGDGELLRLI